MDLVEVQEVPRLGYDMDNERARVWGDSRDEGRTREGEALEEISELREGVVENCEAQE